ncbi:MAG: antitoxin VapB family protein [Nanoarchaeota archaeon]|nr:antitoxin VapB family protein [Nanoarchaeota archaeon]MBU1445441.1 antitoxin VapB family protein [Nanoarchaeota archaeon]MBU2420249.1 antitoxin VapB family protein [Nanoarchaeota archaeon]MBU2474988.1 antitoxin VapB family protein [Nanoarchaeota archaeon]MBU3940598.1 antitoxin VapB family protein [Nanoarchaeota archaeon]
MNTTISIPKELCERIKEFGNKGETYSDVISRLYESAKERQLHDLLMGEKGTITVEKALAKAKKTWQK